MRILDFTPKLNIYWFDTNELFFSNVILNHYSDNIFKINLIKHMRFEFILIALLGRLG